MKKDCIMRMIVLLLLLFAINCFAENDEDLNLESYFKNYNGCFVLYDLQKNITKRYNAKQCAERLTPCSSFKIANALIGLETGVLKTSDQIFKWDGKSYPLNAWNKDLTLKEAMTVSAVPVFQRVAEQIGTERMKDYLNRFDYGNKDISGGISKFWLVSSLKISANEQALFLKKILLNELDVKRKSLNVLLEILDNGRIKCGHLYGKTGTKMGEGLGLGWFVGFIRTDDGRTFIFASNIESPQSASGLEAKKIAVNILEDIIK